VYAFPPEWQTTDDLNPGTFTYTAKIFGLDVVEGKIKAREKTDKEI